MLWLSFLWLQVFAQWLTQSRNSLTIPWIIDKFLKVKSCPKSSNRIIQTYQKFIHQKCFIQSSQFEREHIPSWCDHCLKHFGNANFEILSACGTFFWTSSKLENFRPFRGWVWFFDNDQNHWAASVLRKSQCYFWFASPTVKKNKSKHTKLANKSWGMNVSCKLTLLIFPK